MGEMTIAGATDAERDEVVELADEVLGLVREKAGPTMALNVLVGALACVLATHSDDFEHNMKLAVEVLEGQARHIRKLVTQ